MARTWPKTMIKVNNVYVPDPSEMTWGRSRISSSDAGRDQSGTMHVGTVCFKRTLSLTWKSPPPDIIAAIINAFCPEDADTVSVTYHDAATNATATKIFYTGDITAPVYWWKAGREIYSQVSFQITEV